MNIINDRFLDREAKGEEEFISKAFSEWIDSVDFGALPRTMLMRRAGKGGGKGKLIGFN